MIKIYSSDNTIQSGHIMSLLEAHGIHCQMKNMLLSGGIGELPINECWPEVWLLNDEDYQRADKLIKEMINDRPSNTPPWQCSCGEKNEAQFELCWSCGQENTDN